MNIAHYSTVEDQLAATPLIGRNTFINQFSESTRQPGVTILFIQGDPGIGKTRLVKHLLEWAAENLTEVGLVAQYLTDLYHTQSHDREGFVRALAVGFPDHKRLLKGFASKQDYLDKLRLSGAVRQSQEALADMLKIFTAELGELSRQRKVIFALDTAERWVYDPGAGQQKADAWPWLLELIGTLENALIIIAGRPPIQALAEDARQHGINVIERELPPFNLEEARSYVHTILKKQGQFEFQDREFEALCLLSGRSPIMLALFLYNYLKSGTPKKISQLVDKAKQYKESQPEQQLEIRRDFERDIVAELMEHDRLGDVLRAIGRAPKGVDEKLLARVMQISRQQAFTLLEEVKQYVFAKEYAVARETRLSPELSRVFLHDKVYDLLREYVYSILSDSYESQVGFESIDAYYEEENVGVIDGLIGIYDRASQGEYTVRSGELTDKENYRSQVLSETVYYHFRHDPVNGLKYFTRFVHQAVITNMPEMLIPLGSELSACLAGIDPGRPIEPGLRYFLSQLSSLMAVQRAFAARDYPQVVTLCREIGQQLSPGSRIYQKENRVLQAVLNIWDGYARILFDLSSRPDKSFQEAIHMLKSVKQPAEWLEWYIGYALGLAHRVSGYYYRVMGFHTRAIDEYLAALPYLKRSNLKSELAYTQNDLGFALAEQGIFFEASANVGTALSLRKELGLGRQMGLSINTSALIDLRSGSYREAKQKAEEALRLFNALNDQRGIGLALISLAEAKRRLATSEEVLLDNKEKNTLLLEACEHADQAAGIFSKEELGEVSREVEACIEAGCALRDRIRINQVNPPSDFNLNHLVRESRAMLGRAAALAGEKGILYRHVDALVNQAWLEYYIGHSQPEDFRRIDGAVARAEAGFPPGTIPEVPRRGRSKMQPKDILHSQLGKLHALKALAALERWKLGEADQLKLAAQGYLLALEYNRWFAEDSRDMRLAKNAVRREIGALKAKQQGQFAEAVQEVEGEFQMKNSTLQEYLKYSGLWQIE